MSAEHSEAMPAKQTGPSRKSLLNNEFISLQASREALALLKKGYKFTITYDGKGLPSTKWTDPAGQDCDPYASLASVKQANLAAESKRQREAIVKRLDEAREALLGHYGEQQVAAVRAYFVGNPTEPVPEGAPRDLVAALRTAKTWRTFLGQREALGQEDRPQAVPQAAPE